MIRTLALLPLLLCLTGCYTNILAPGAAGTVVDADTGAPVCSARITRPTITGGLDGNNPFAPPEGIPAATVLSDQKGHFSLAPATETQIAFMVVRNPKSISRSFLVSADGYATNVLHGTASSSSLWRVELGRIALQRP
jgi:hypothetical protein